MDGCMGVGALAREGLHKMRNLDLYHATQNGSGNKLDAVIQNWEENVRSWEQQ